jgi:hypothetical protein
LIGYVVLMRIDSATFRWFRPRGGMVTQALSLAIANFAIWIAAESYRPLNFRFQLAAAGRIWIFTQPLGIAYILYVKTDEG